ncbi:DUF6265 family protein [Flavobacterium sp.]|uniref:DUF6265 family protein n=1 Tax=Flavobacterium sp. TaxID=239 RepID=UPI002624F1A3|nr:DUF6265 family protein [Flavobacterium sp.]
MKKTILIVAAMALTTAFISCQKKENTTTTEESAKTFAQIEKANWLVGEWGNTTKEGVLTETWIKQNDSTMTGQSFFIIGKDTVNSESIVLVQKEDHLLYVPTVKNQNDSKPVEFNMISSTESQFVFENKQHDFPQKITYTKITADSLVAEISGIMDGKESKESYPMKKK